jgi:hypothetical protein
MAGLPPRTDDHAIRSCSVAPARPRGTDAALAHPIERAICAGLLGGLAACAAAPSGTTSTPEPATSAATKPPPPPLVLGALLPAENVGPQEPPGAHASAADRAVVLGEDIASVPAGADPADDFPVHGSLSSVFRTRSSEGDHDNDVTEVVALDFGDPARHAWTGHLMARLNADLDGRDDGSSRLNDINDTYDEALVPHVYDAWAERRDLGAVDSVRLGRQTIWDTPVFAWFDGVSAATKPLTKSKMSFGAYGGIPVHLYESSRDGDLLAGAWAQAEPWKDGRVRLDWMHPEDDGSLGEHVDNLWRASAWQAFGESLRVDGWFTGLDGQDRDFTARATWAALEQDFTLSATWFELLRTQRDHAPELDPYFETLQELEPYRQVRIVAAKGFGAHVNVQAGIDVRDVTHSEDEGPFNRDFDRVFAMGTLSELLPGKIDLSLTGEQWDANGSDIESWGLDLSRRFGNDVRASIGTFYALYKVDSFNVDEREDVRTYYARARWHRTESTTWDARIDHEDTSQGDFTAFLLGMTWAF